MPETGALIKETAGERTRLIQSVGYLSDVQVCYRPTPDTWSVNEKLEHLADLLVKDGLSLDQKEMELLVCHAGESVNTVKRSNYLMKMRNKIVETGKVNADAANRLSNQLQSETRNEKTPEFYDAEHSSGRELPLGAQRAQALKNHNFKNLLITCYQAPITSTFHNGVVCLNLKGKKRLTGEKSDQTDVPVTSPEGGRHHVLWRACY